LGRVFAGLLEGLLGELVVIPKRKKNWAFSKFLKGLKGFRVESSHKPKLTGTRASSEPSSFC
jgi:hypothetical protein